jgi:hypothetical protein
VLVSQIKVLGCFGLDNDDLIDHDIRILVANPYPIVPHCDWNLLPDCMSPFAEFVDERILIYLFQNPYPRML